MATTQLSDARPRAPRIPLRAFSRTEKVIAFCRMLLLAAASTIMLVDPKLLWSPLGPFIVITFLLYGGFSILVFALVRSERVRQENIARASVVVDVIAVTALTLLTDSGVSPFFLLHVFVISSVSVRWGLIATVQITVLLAALYPLVAFAASRVFDPTLFNFSRAHFFRPLYLLALGYLIGYLGEHERQSRRKLGFMLELLAAVRRRRPTGRTLTLLMRQLLRFLNAEHAHLTVLDPDSGRYFTWSVLRQPHEATVRLRITDEQPYRFVFAAATEGFLLNDVRPKRPSALCYDVVTGALTRRFITPPLELPAPDIQAMLVSPILLQRRLQGYVIIGTTTKRRFTREDLEFLLVFVAQGAAGFETVRLQEKAEEVAVLEERARIARDLHDGFIQSLAAIDLRVEAAKVLVERTPERLPRALEELHQVVDRGYQDVRHYLTVLRNTSRPTEGFLTVLDRLAAEFSLRSRIRVLLSRPDRDPGLPPGLTHEITQIVRESLHNAVRHGQASQAVVKVGARPTHVYLVVRDNGRGYPGAGQRPDADGFLPRGAEPWSIRERVEAFGGELRVWTQSGQGTEVSLWLPLHGTAPGALATAGEGRS
ncbi:MAG TPA: GAF domain-containing sensor histidine kinase [Candidatus Limnocylindria bacterium]|nr:GAF domain-containing sensor histidine kinase [Candidatus Limnocylindria bacterium]